MGDFLRMMEDLHNDNMILYSVNCRAAITNGEWSIVTIHKSLEGAEKALEIYKQNWKESPYGADYAEYKIITINTDTDSDVVYDCTEI